MRPESKGQIHVTGADPRRPPAINFNFLSSPPDAELTVCAVRIARAIMTAPAMALFQVSEVVPGADLTTDDEILDWVKQAAETTYHPVGTCKMGSDPSAVVDAQLRVHGIGGRVPSISIAFNLRLSDVAEVRRGYEDPPTLLIRHQGEPALALGVVRRQAAREFASPKVRFAMDSPLEGDGFELPVPRHKSREFPQFRAQAPLLIAVDEPPRPVDLADHQAAGARISDN